jgi:hypothetical protein
MERQTRILPKKKRVNYNKSPSISVSLVLRLVILLHELNRLLDRIPYENRPRKEHLWRIALLGPRHLNPVEKGWLCWRTTDSRLVGLLLLGWAEMLVVAGNVGKRYRVLLLVLHWGRPVGPLGELGVIEWTLAGFPRWCLWSP